MLAFLEKSPLLVLFGVAGLGYLLGKVRVGGFGFGVAAVLFVGLGVGALDRKLELPELVQQVGLVLFVYTLGLSSGPGFFASLRTKGLKTNLFALGIVAASALASFGFGKLASASGGRTAGLFAGALTNTPALAAVVEAAKERGADAATAADPVVAYSLCYPLGVVAVLVAIWIAKRVSRRGEPEPVSRSYAAAGDEPVVNATVRVGAAAGMLAETARKGADYSVSFGRMERGGALAVVADDTRFEKDDLVTVVGRAGDVARATKALGEASERAIDLDRRVLDYRRMFVSNADVTERPLRELELPRKYGAVITRVRRGDVELVPDADFSLDLGDRARVVAPRERLAAVEKLLGDSYKRLAEIDVITFSLGIALGLVIGAIPVPLPGGTEFKLGIAGGPLVAGLVLGRVGRAGKLVFTLPWSANLTLRQLGITLFLACVGTRSGFAFASTLRDGGTGALLLLGAGALVTVAMATATLVLGRKLLRVPTDVLVGMLSGIQTQPAALVFATEQTENELPNVGYAAVYPVATIAKIVLAQVLLAAMR
jgi:putative transport protein